MTERRLDEERTRMVLARDHAVLPGDVAVHPRARQSLLEAIDHLRALGAEAVILGCTEFPLAVPEPDADGIPLIDPTVVIARALIRETYPERLRHASVEREPQAA